MLVCRLFYEMSIDNPTLHYSLNAHFLIVSDSDLDGCALSFDLHLILKNFRRQEYMLFTYYLIVGW